MLRKLIDYYHAFLSLAINQIFLGHWSLFYKISTQMRIISIAETRSDKLCFLLHFMTFYGDIHVWLVKRLVFFRKEGEGYRI